MREQAVRVNEEELESLKDLRDSEYPGVPLGFVIRELLKDTDNW